MDEGFVPGDVKTVIVGPCNDRPGAVKLGNNQSITQEEADMAKKVNIESLYLVEPFDKEFDI